MPIVKMDRAYTWLKQRLLRSKIEKRIGKRTMMVKFVSISSILGRTTDLV